MKIFELEMCFYDTSRFYTGSKDVLLWGNIVRGTKPLDGIQITKFFIFNLDNISFILIGGKDKKLLLVRNFLD